MMAAMSAMSQRGDSYVSNFKNWNSKDSVNMDEERMQSLKVLDPDDPLMERFQNALRTHLQRIDERLSEDISKLQAATKQAIKTREDKSSEMYEAQREISQQQSLMGKYINSLEGVKRSREENEKKIAEVKKIRNSVREETETERHRAGQLTREMESLASHCKQFSEFEEEISNHILLAERMSEKDATVQRELLRQKQEADYILLKLSDHVWNMEKEIQDLHSQIGIKNEERLAMGQTIADADADLVALQRERKGLLVSWNGVVSSILQRDKINNELSQEKGKIRESFKTLQVRIEKIKKDTIKEMENNERLTLIQSRLEEDIRCNQSAMEVERDKSDVLEHKTIEIAKLLEKTQAEYNATLNEYQRFKFDEKNIQAEIEKLSRQKNLLEDEILSKLEDKVTNDKAVRFLNKMLRDARESIDEMELSMIQTENQYGKNLLELEKLNNYVSMEKSDLEEISQLNSLKEKDLDKIRVETERCDISIEKKQKKIVDLNKKIEEMNALNGKIDMSSQDLKISGLERNIDEIEAKNQESQQFWLRQECSMVNLSEERNAQLQDLNRLSKQITIMDQKNIKLEYALTKEKKEEDTIDRRMNELRHRLLRTNSFVAEQKELRDNLQDKNFITQDEYVKKLQDEEMNLARLQNDIRDSTNEKSLLEEKLCDAHREFISWEKKVKIAAETSKTIRDERNAGGDVALMKSEIHKMEMRLSHLKKAQEKMIRDMEFCVSRRDTIIDGALAKEKKNPKGLHNKRVMFQKRMDDRRMKIKQMVKESKNIENRISELENERLKIQEELDESQKTLNSFLDSIPDIDRKMFEGDLIKCHKLECLVRKQRKVLMLQKVRDGKYKMLFKSESSLNDELEKQRSMNVELAEIMEQTKKDFPRLKDDIYKIQLTLQSS